MRLCGSTLRLPSGDKNAFGRVEQTIYALNNISEVFSDMATSPSLELLATTTVEATVQDTKEFINNISCKICNYCNCDDFCIKKIAEEHEEFVFRIIEILKANNKIEKEDLEGILGEVICENIDNVILAINLEYEKHIINNIWQKRIDESKAVALNQLKGVSRAINEIANDLTKENTVGEDVIRVQKEKVIKKFIDKGIEFKDINISKEYDKYTVSIYSNSCVETNDCKIYTIKNILSEVLGQKMISSKIDCGTKLLSGICVQKYISAGRYKVSLGVSKATQNRSTTSGDSSSFMELQDGKFLIALSDGMGSGPKAEKNSNLAIENLERMLSSGFNKKTALELINTNLLLRSNEETFSTIDMSIIDLYNGNIEFVKLSACPTYIKNTKNVQLIQSLSLPVGILNDIDIDLYHKNLQKDDIIVMITDGILDSKETIERKELWVKDLLENIETTNPQRIADIILQEALDNGYGIAKDDMTVLVAKIIEN